MPFNADTYRRNKARRLRNEAMQGARLAKRAAETTDDPRWRTTWRDVFHG